MWGKEVRDILGKTHRGHASCAGQGWLEAGPPIPGVKSAADAPRWLELGGIRNAVSAALAGCASPWRVYVPAPPRLREV